jgi:tetratricopeptide (TPR) repeat protein
MVRSTNKMPLSSMQIASQHMAAGRFAEAEELYQDLLDDNPKAHEALFHMALLSTLQKDYPAAIAYYRQVLELTPNMIEALNNLGAVYFEQRDLDNALVCFRHALGLQPNSVETHNNIGNVLKDQGKFDEALFCYQKSLRLKPGNASVMSNMGDVLRRLGRHQEAVDTLRKALIIQPHFPEAEWNLALTLFMLGDLEKGFALYEKRLEIAHPEEYARAGIGNILPQLTQKQRWQGEDLQGKRVLIWTEQGIGDNLMMMRYLPLLRQKGAATVIVYCPQMLVKLMQSFDVRVISTQKNIPLDDFDLHCPIMSLPFMFGTRLENIPNAVPYLHVPDPAQKKWAKQLASYAGVKVGLVWAGNHTLKSDYLRSISLQEFAPLMLTEGVQFFSLQKNEAAQQLKNCSWNIVDKMDRCDDLMDTAALIQNLDLVISVDTAVAHLAGALGKPVWLLNRFESEWRWMVGREDSPWYPSLRLFCQPVAHDWRSVLQRVSDELAQWTRAYQPNTIPAANNKSFVARLFGR